MELQEEKKGVVYKYKFDCTPEEEIALKKIAIERFAKDTQAQLEYAVNSILAEAIDTMTLSRLTELKK